MSVTDIVQESFTHIKSKIEKIQTLVEGTEQDIEDMADLKNMKNTVDFLQEEAGPRELYMHHDKEFDKPYRSFGYFNNIVHKIDRNCECDKYE